MLTMSFRYKYCCCKKKWWFEVKYDSYRNAPSQDIEWKSCSTQNETHKLLKMLTTSKTFLKNQNKKSNQKSISFIQLIVDHEYYFVSQNVYHLSR